MIELAFKVVVLLLICTLPCLVLAVGLEKLDNWIQGSDERKR